MYKIAPSTEEERELLERLKKFDTPTITNVVATYPANHEFCLGLYDPWECNWYTDQSLKCIYPELGRFTGFAVTCIYGMPTPNYDRLTMLDLLKSIEESPKPAVVVMKQDLPEEIKNKSGLSGGNMTTAMQTLGAVACISDGPSRDIDEIRPMGFQYFLTGVTAGHGNYSVKAVDVPVNICSMDVAPGDVLHMDENGVVKFPRKYLKEVVETAEKLMEHEKNCQSDIRKCTKAEDVFKVIEKLNESR